MAGAEAMRNRNDLTFNFLSQTQEGERYDTTNKSFCLLLANMPTFATTQVDRSDR